MDKLSDLKPGDVLGQVDLGSYIAAMGKGVAEAQRALDDNTIGLLGAFTEKLEGLRGKSLIQLGLSPAFYHFRSATISASVTMSMQVRQEFDIALHVEAGKGSSSSSSTATSVKQISSAHEKVIFSNHVAETKSEASGASAMEAIDSYAESNASTSSHFVLAERLAVAVAGKSALKGSGLVLYNAAADLYAVPPAGREWAVLHLAAPANGEVYQIKPGSPPYAPTVGTTPSDMAQAIKSMVKAAYILPAAAVPGDLREVRFDTNSHVVKEVGGVDYSARLRGLAQIVDAATLDPVAVAGHTDGVGPAGYNQRLSELRAASVRDVLVTYNVAVSAATGQGETGATDNQPDQSQRWARVAVKPFAGCFIYIEDDPGILAGNIGGQVKAGAYPANGEGLVQAGNVSSASALAAQLANEAKIEASLSGELVYLTNSKTSGAAVAKVQLFAAQSSSSSSQSDSSTDLDVNQGRSTNTALDQLSKTEVNRAAAVAGSLDVRFARMFDVSMSGNMSIAAELVSVPAPAEFLQFIKDYLED
jgi:outer membrane protein OmpA-like peptidoglycan-associated protein